MQNEEQMFVENKKLINYVINRIGILYDIEGCYDVGELALLDAIRSFDNTKKCKFSSYAVNCIQYKIYNYLCYKSRQKRKNDFLNISLEKQILDNANLIEIIDSGIDLEKEVIKKEKIDLLNRIIEILDPNDSYMIKHYFGLGSCEKMTQKEIAEILGKDQRYVSYRIKRAFKIIRKIMEGRI